MKLARATVVCLFFWSMATPALALPAPSLSQDPALPAPQTDAQVDAPAKVQVGTPHIAIPFKQEKQSTDTLAYQSLAALILVGLAAYGIVFGLKRSGQMTGGPLGKARRARTVDAIRLGRRSMLYVVEYQGKELLLAESEHGVQLLISGPATTQQAAPATADQGAANA